MNKLVQFFSGKMMMAICIAACALPFVFIMIVGGKANLSWLGLIACVGIHLVMMKMMPGHKSCHESEKKAESIPLPLTKKTTLDV